MNPQGKVLDNNNGTYDLQYTLESPGEHSLFVMVNGSPLNKDGLLLTAEYGPLAANQCRAYMERTGGGKHGSACGTTQAVIIEVLP